jgi:hypothetical protein
LLAGALVRDGRSADQFGPTVEVAAELAARHGFHGEQVALAELAARSVSR